MAVCEHVAREAQVEFVTDSLVTKNTFDAVPQAVEVSVNDDIFSNIYLRASPSAASPFGLPRTSRNG